MCVLVSVCVFILMHFDTGLERELHLRKKYAQRVGEKHREREGESRCEWERERETDVACEKANGMRKIANE